MLSIDETIKMFKQLTEEMSDLLKQDPNINSDKLCSSFVDIKNRYNDLNNSARKELNLEFDSVEVIAIFSTLSGEKMDDITVSFSEVLFNNELKNSRINDKCINKFLSNVSKYNNKKGMKKRTLDEISNTEPSEPTEEQIFKKIHSLFEGEEVISLED